MSNFNFPFNSPFGDDEEASVLPQAAETESNVPDSKLPNEEANGIFQSDVIIRTALVKGIEDLRKNPNLLDYVFASLPRDELTLKEYGEKSVQRAKEWFLKTDIPVSMVPRIDEGDWPRITISLADSQEFENTLGDVHYVPVEFSTHNLNNEWPALTLPFAVTHYDPALGQFKIPSTVTLLVVPGMYITDDVGVAHLIVSQDDDFWYITADTNASFSKATIKGRRPSTAVHMESATFKETYHIGVHVGSEPVYLTWLHSIVVFILLRYRQALLEARGFERSSFTSSSFTKEDNFDAELVFSRYITINGVVRQYWPKDIVPTINSVQPILKVYPANLLPTSSDDLDKNQSIWVGDSDIDLDRDGIG